MGSHNLEISNLHHPPPPPNQGYVTWVLIKDFGKHSHQHLTLENLMASKGSSGSTKLETAYLIAESVDNL